MSEVWEAFFDRKESNCLDSHSLEDLKDQVEEYFGSDEDMNITLFSIHKDGERINKQEFSKIFNELEKRIIDTRKAREDAEDAFADIRTDYFSNLI